MLWREIKSYSLNKILNQEQQDRGRNGDSSKNKVYIETTSFKCVELDSIKPNNQPKIAGTGLARCLLYKNSIEIPQVASVLSIYSLGVRKDVNPIDEKPSIVLETFKIKIPSNPMYPQPFYFSPHFKLSDNFLVVDFVDNTAKYVRYQMLNHSRGYWIWDLSVS